MGGAQSRTTVEALTEVINNVVSQSVQTCEQRTEQTQAAEQVNYGFGIWAELKMQQQSEIDAACFASRQLEVDLQNKIYNTIAQAADAQGVALIGAFGSANASAHATLHNKIQNTITMQNIQKSYNSIKQSQTGKQTNIGGFMYATADLQQGAKLFAAATVQEMSRAGIFTQIEQYLDQQAQAEQTNPIADFFTGIGGIIVGAILFFVVIVFMGILLLRSGGSSDNAPSYAPYASAPTV